MEKSETRHVDITAHRLAEVEASMVQIKDELHQLNAWREQVTLDMQEDVSQLNSKIDLLQQSYEHTSQINSQLLFMVRLVLALATLTAVLNGLWMIKN